MYLDTSDPPQIVPNPPDTTGLWIYPRESYSPVKVSIPEDCLGKSSYHMYWVSSGRRLIIGGSFPNR